MTTDEILIAKSAAQYIHEYMPSSYRSENSREFMVDECRHQFKILASAMGYVYQSKGLRSEDVQRDQNG